MEKQNSPGLWIAAAALTAVVAMLIVTPGRKPDAPAKVAEQNNGTETTKPKPAPESPSPDQESPATEPLSPVPPAPKVASVPAVPAVPVIPQSDDAPPPPPPKPIVPAGREEARQVLDNIHFALRDYRAAMGGNPVGTNAEITSSLLGNNLKQVKVPLPDGSTVNGSGEMCDPWGTPYFFHQMSATKMEIRSAGADRQLYTPDDVTM